MNKNKSYETSRSQALIDSVSEDSTTYSSLILSERTIEWQSGVHRAHVVREGIPYSALEVLSKEFNTSVKALLELIRVPQTTYNKKKANNALLDPLQSELVARIKELLDFGTTVFDNDRASFLNWLQIKNLTLGDITPWSLMDTISGIEEVHGCLLRIEYGILA